MPGALSQNIFACFIVFLIANFINRLVIRNRLTKDFSLIPGLVFILISATVKETLTLSPALISCFFLMLGLLYLNRTYKNRDAEVHIFNVGFFISISAIFYPAILILWIFGIIGLLNLRSLKFHELIIFFSGFFVPFFLLWTYYFWYDKGPVVFDYIQINQTVLRIFKGFGIEGIIILVLIIVGVGYALFRYNFYTIKTSLQVQKKIDIIYWLMLFSFISMFFKNNINETHLAILMLPISVFLGISYERMKDGLLAELIHVGVVLTILIIQFQYY